MQFIELIKYCFTSGCDPSNLHLLLLQKEIGCLSSFRILCFYGKHYYVFCYTVANTFFLLFCNFPFLRYSGKRDQPNRNLKPETEQQHDKWFILQRMIFCSKLMIMQPEMGIFVILTSQVCVCKVIYLFKICLEVSDMTLKFYITTNSSLNDF